MSIALVCIIGIATVFVGLICLIAITMIMSAVIRSLKRPDKAMAPNLSSAAANAPIANKAEIIAGVCAVIAEELGEDVSNIRVTSFKKL